MDNSIAQVHSNCVSVFLTLIGVLNTSRHWDNQNEVRDALDRYKLWAGNVGAMHSGTRYKSSLDYRLREASFYKDQVLRLMQDLHNSLNKALTAAQTESKPARDRNTEHAEPPDTDEDESDLSDSPWEVSSDSEVEHSSKQKLPQQNLGRPVPASQSPAKPALLDPINFIIDCLWRLPIRSPAPIDRMKKKYITDITAYLPFDIMYVKDKFPNLNETVTARLAKMISKRRQLIQYRKDHTDALKEKEVTVIDVSKLERGRLSTPAEREIASESTPCTRVPSQKTELTKATTLEIAAPIALFSPVVGLYTPSVSDFASSTVSEQTANAITIRPPNRPRTDRGQLLDRFICPYCSTAQMITSERQWKKHVLSDLQPYICTYPDCQIHEYVFDNIHDWFRHESQTHRVEWFCNTESHESFADVKDFLNHMNTIHSDSEPLDEAQLLSLQRGFQRPSNAASGTCTLCGEHASRLKSHLARHLEQLALFAILQTDYMAALEEDDTSSNAARQGVPALSSLGSENAPTELSDRKFGSEVSIGSLHTPSLGPERPAWAASDAQYFKWPEESAMGSSNDVREEVDTSWDQITSKFKDARVEMSGYREQETKVYMNLPFIRSVATDEESTSTLVMGSEEPRDTVPLAQRDTRSNIMPAPTPPPSLRARAGRITSNLFSSFRNRNQKEDRYRANPHGQPIDRTYPDRSTTLNQNRFGVVFDRDTHDLAYEPTISRISSDVLPPSIQQSESESYTENRPMEVVNAKEKRTWRRRLSRAMGIRRKSPQPKPFVSYLSYYPTTSDLGDVPPSIYESMRAHGSMESVPAIEYPEGEVFESNPDSAPVELPR